MKMVKNYLLFVSMTLAAVLFSGCSDDDDNNTPQFDGIIASQNDPDLIVEDLQGSITGDITLSADEDWLLTGPLVVNAGGSLTIEAGTTITAQAGGTNVYIAVERNAQIFVEGTSVAPVTITSSAANPASGDWGGLIIMGNAEITGTTTATTEVVDFTYGNTTPIDNDNSGTITYLILEYTGARINAEKEFNGLTLYGVGAGTTINNVAIFYGDDDAIEWFGGSVNVSNLLVVNATDDMFDYTQGWDGTLTNAYGIREFGYDEVSADPRGIEGDGNLDGLTPEGTPQSNPTILNMTVANYSTVDNSGNSGLVDVFKIRRGTSGSFTNLLFIQGENVPAPADFVDCTDGSGDAAAETTINASAEGADAATVEADLKAGANNATITVPANKNTGCPTNIFAWTGYQFN